MKRWPGGTYRGQGKTRRRRRYRGGAGSRLRGRKEPRPTRGLEVETGNRMREKGRESVRNGARALSFAPPL